MTCKRSSRCAVLPWFHSTGIVSDHHCAMTDTSDASLDCWNNTYGISAHGSSHKEMLCSGTFTVPDNLKTGIHTFVWSWLWNGKWDCKLVTALYQTWLIIRTVMADDIVYLSCFQYDVKGIGGSYPMSKKTPPRYVALAHRLVMCAQSSRHCSVGFTANLTNYMQAPSELTKSGGNGMPTALLHLKYMLI